MILGLRTVKYGNFWSYPALDERVKYFLFVDVNKLERIFFEVAFVLDFLVSGTNSQFKLFIENGFDDAERLFEEGVRHFDGVVFGEVNYIHYFTIIKL